MNLCQECFSSGLLNKVIADSPVEGFCDFHGGGQRKIVTPESVSLFFEPLFALYDENASGKPMATVLLKEFGDQIFSKSHVSVQRRRILTEVFKTTNFQAKVKVQPITMSIIDDASALDLWNDLTKELVEQNRFFLSTDLSLVVKNYERFFNLLVDSVEDSRILYRGRLTDKIAFRKTSMGAPPASFASAGRANPEGISYLYLGSDIDTVLNETRSSSAQKITVGYFRTKSPRSIINLSKSHDIDILGILDSEGDPDLIYDYYRATPMLQSFREALSTPYLKSKTSLNYLPSQYLCEFIKSLGYDGVLYDSSLCPDGENYVFFDPSIFECYKTNTYSVPHIRLADM